MVILKLISIAGSDPSGGAGIQMDLKVFSTLGAYGMAVPTALTVQNTKGVIEVINIPPQQVISQIKAVLEDITVDGIKIGMLGDVRLAADLANLLKKYKIPIVFDPVLKSTTGYSLTKGDISALEELMHICTVITPNKRELQAITGCEDATKAIKRLAEIGVKAAVITGADSEEEYVEDLIWNGKGLSIFKHPRIRIEPGTHGTGCAFSSALLFFICSGRPLKEAYLFARDFVKRGLVGALRVGSGIVPVRPEANIEQDAQRYRVIVNLQDALCKLKKIPEIHLLIPEVQSNLGECIENPQGIEDVAAFPGRIIRLKEGITTASCPEFGASSHVARIILAANRADPSIRACMNIKFSEKWIGELHSAGFSISFFDRKEEPAKIKEREGSTLDWGTEAAIKRFGSVPDIIYDKGDVGKEPMIRVLGKDALDVVEKIRRIVKVLFHSN